jgi:hypothetical protein
MTAIIISTIPTYLARVEAKIKITPKIISRIGFTEIKNE